MSLEWSFSIKWLGTELPAAIPVRRCSNPVRGTSPEERSSSSETNIVATPYKPVADSSWMDRRVALALKLSLGNKMQDPWVAVAMYPRILPKQWKRGGGQQIMSEGVRPIREPMKYPLLRIEWWVRQAAFGVDVVPDVNWMLIISSLCRGSSGMIVFSA